MGIAAQAARDVADARMKAELVHINENPKPIIHEAASQAVKIATPIATEMATQTASLQATIQAVAAAKRLLQEQNSASMAAAKAGDQVVESADRKLKDEMRTRVRKSVSR